MLSNIASKKVVKQSICDIQVLCMREGELVDYKNWVFTLMASLAEHLQTSQ